MYALIIDLAWVLDFDGIKSEYPVCFIVWWYKIENKKVMMIIKQAISVVSTFLQRLYLRNSLIIKNRGQLFLCKIKMGGVTYWYPMRRGSLGP